MSIYEDIEKFINFAKKEMAPKASTYIKSISLFAGMVAIITFITVLLKNLLQHLEISTEISRVIALVVVFSGYYCAYRWLSRKMKEIKGR